MDLDFKKLKFNRTYDINRQKRGKGIYQRGEVQVDRVEKIGEDEYAIDAEVNRREGLYIVNLLIKNGTVDEATCTCADFNNGNLCKHILATSMEVISPHYASTVEGKKREEERRIAEFKKRQQIERETRKYKEKYGKGLETIEFYRTSEENNSNKKYLDLEELYLESQDIKKKE